uniref:Permease of the drug/metabolite transporter (DMT) superfamily n=1 Tax=Loigolactobacillus rennini TaxID=238013 RepID=A0A1K2I8F5_9LACO|nr:Permease of the drug/metabolite transporter (DMT) superfamily [Loigolactobacillus rennini]
MRLKQLQGIFLAAIGALFWGISGPIAQFLFTQYHMSLNWLVESKMLISGLLLLLLCLLLPKERKRLFAIWHSGRDVAALLIFMLGGMFAMQYIYYKAVAVGNAATATILQFLSPVFIVVYTVFREHVHPRRPDLIAVLVALSGTFLLVTGGNPTHLTMSPRALFWGVATGLAAAAYVLLPAKLLVKYGTLAISGWAMTIGGILFNFVQPIWRDVPHFDLIGHLGYWFVVLLGSVVAYTAYLASLDYISATAVGLLDAFEPLAATTLSVLFLNVHFGWIQLIGALFILSTVFILALARPQPIDQQASS